jgi:HAD superfamily hydrolase (TIGR01484 family)
MTRNTHETLTPLAQCPRETLAAIEGVLTDIDETVSTHSQLTAEAYGAMEALKKAGFRVIPVTGRPAGWCDLIARFWPVDAVVGENGAFWMWHDDKAHKLRTRFVQDDSARAEGKRRLETVRAQVLADVPGAGIASDQPYRAADLAIDFCEDVPALPEADIDRIVRIFERAGAQAKVSSIHVNGWFGEYDKLSMAKTLLADIFGIDWNGAQDTVVFAGDSPNDEPMFAAFPLSVGVANVHAFAHRLKNKPAYITNGHSGEGFAELASVLLDARSGSASA